MPVKRLYGLVAEFDAPGPLLYAAACTREAGYQRVEAYTPFPVEGLADAVDPRSTWLPLVVLLGGIIGAVGGYGMQYYLAVIDYPINVGGRPLHSWPSFLVITFELTVLCAALAAVLGMLALNGLPMPYHPLFNVPQFALASRDRFFLCVEAKDPKFDREGTRAFLLTLHPRDVQEVPM
jgi:hypothetical protein